MQWWQHTIKELLKIKPHRRVCVRRACKHSIPSWKTGYYFSRREQKKNKINFFKAQKYKLLENTLRSNNNCIVWIRRSVALFNFFRTLAVFMRFSIKPVLCLYVKSNFHRKIKESNKIPQSNGTCMDFDGTTGRGQFSFRPLSLFSQYSFPLNLQF